MLYVIDNIYMAKLNPCKTIDDERLKVAIRVRRYRARKAAKKLEQEKKDIGTKILDKLLGRNK